MKAALSRAMNKNLGTFNRTLIKDTRINDKIEDHLDIAFRTLEKYFDGLVQYKGYQFSYMVSDTKRSNAIEGSDNIKKYPHKMTYSKLCNFKFDITTDTGEIKEHILPIWLPILTENKIHFKIKGAFYNAPFQLVDSVIYTKGSQMVILKTLFRALKFSKKKQEMLDLYGNKFVGNALVLYLVGNVKPISILLYFFCKYGINKTNEFFLGSSAKYIKIVSEMNKEEMDEVSKTNYIFEFGQVFLVVSKIQFDASDLIQRYIASILAIISKNNNIKRFITKENIKSVICWKAILGYQMSLLTNAQQTLDIEKAEVATRYINTFENSFDIFTRKMVNIDYPEFGEKKTIYEFIRFMFLRFPILSHQNKSLQHKRLCCSEYLVSIVKFTIIQRYFEIVKRYKTKPRTFEFYRNIFKCPENIILNYMSGKFKDPENNHPGIVAYVGGVNDLQGIIDSLRFNKNGPGTPLSKRSESVPMEEKRIYPNHYGNLDLITSSSKKVGATGLLCPMIDIDEGLRFKIHPDLMEK